MVIEALHICPTTPMLKQMHRMTPRRHRHYKITHIHKCTCSTRVTESQIYLRFSLRPTVFELQVTGQRKVPRMTPKWPRTLQGQRYPIHAILESLSPRFHSVRSMATRLGLHAIWRQMHRMNPKWHCTSQFRRYPIMFYQCSIESQISFCFAQYGQSFSS